ncbi:MAG: TlpA family protein disulfide reductase [Deltaproteobacteria bacterium]|nr:TlpA family protein disulfide reductase [Deltaproteobacteria bacterium]
MYAQYRSRDFVLFRINTKETRETVAKFLEKEALQVPILLDKNGKVGRLFGVWAHPTSYLIDRKGMVRYRSVGLVDWADSDARSIIEQLLNER